MSLFDMLQQAGGGGGLERLAQQFGVDRQTAEGLAGLLAPAVGTAARRRAEAGRFDDVARQLRGEREARFFDEPERAAEADGRAQGARFLEEMLGGADAREQLTARAVGRTGVDRSVADSLMPAIAAMLQGGMQRRMPDREIDMMAGGTGRGGGGGLMGIIDGLLGGASRRGRGGSDLSPLMAMLDRDGDGSVVDDLIEGVLRR